MDLYLIHAPVPGARLETWRALEHLKATGKARSIGVSNYGVHHLKELMAVADVKPAVNQIEIHPFFIRDELVVFCEEHGIAVEGYSPLAKARRLTDPDLLLMGGKCVSAPLPPPSARPTPHMPCKIPCERVRVVPLAALTPPPLYHTPPLVAAQVRPVAGTDYAAVGHPTRLHHHPEERQPPAHPRERGRVQLLHRSRGHGHPKREARGPGNRVEPCGRSRVLLMRAAGMAPPRHCVCVCLRVLQRLAVAATGRRGGGVGMM